MDYSLDTQITEVRISGRTKHACSVNNIATIKDLLHCSNREMRHLKRVGLITQEELNGLADGFLSSFNPITDELLGKIKLIKSELDVCKSPSYDHIPYYQNVSVGLEIALEILNQ